MASRGTTKSKPSEFLQLKEGSPHAQLTPKMGYTLAGGATHRPTERLSEKRRRPRPSAD